ncbi:MAG: tol-pal system YbgF family protein [Phycisphaerae bacterium]
MRPEAEGTIQCLLKENPPKGGNLLVARAAKTAYAKALKLYKKHRYAKALKAFEKIARKHKGTLYAKKALRKAKKIKADKKIMAGIRRREMRRKCESWLDTARTLVKMGKTDEAAEYYRRVFEKYPDSKYARVARQEMDSL